MAENEKGEQQQEEGIDIQEAERQQTAGHRLAPPMYQVDFQRGNGHHQDQQYGDEDTFPRRLFLMLRDGISLGGKRYRGISAFCR